MFQRFALRVALIALTFTALALPPLARAADPMKVGLSLALTGPSPPTASNS
jgi:hypothetical protein